MNRQARGQAKFARAQPAAAVPQPVPTARSSRWRGLALIAAAVAACVVVGATAWSMLSTRSKAARQIVQGDGVRGPAGMMWVPGGEFLAKTIPLKSSIVEGLDISMDAGSPVDFTYKPPFRFTGAIDKITFDLK